MGHAIRYLARKVQQMTTALDRLRSDVAALATVNGSVLTLITSLAQQIRDNTGNDEALNALADDIENQAAGLAAAVAANTPAASTTGDTGDNGPPP